jgi:hypothetical protein
MSEPLKTGDHVVITYATRTVRGVVRLASPNGRSLILEFDAMLGGFVGMMPVLQDETTGEYRDLFKGLPAVITHIDKVSS